MHQRVGVSFVRLFCKGFSVDAEAFGKKTHGNFVVKTVEGDFTTEQMNMGVDCFHFYIPNILNILEY